MSSRGRSSRRTRWVLPTRSIDCSFVRIPKGILFSRLIDSPRFVTYLQFSPWFLLLVRFIIIILRSFPRPFKSCQQVLAPANQYLKEQEAKLGSGEIDLNNPLAKPRIPYEILFAIGGWSAGSPTNFVETYDTRLCLSLHTFLRLTPRNASVFISHAGIFIYFATSLQIGANRQIANYIRPFVRISVSLRSPKISDLVVVWSNVSRKILGVPMSDQFLLQSSLVIHSAYRSYKRENLQFSHRSAVKWRTLYFLKVIFVPRS